MCTKSFNFTLKNEKAPHDKLGRFAPSLSSFFEKLTRLAPQEKNSAYGLVCPPKFSFAPHLPPHFKNPGAATVHDIPDPKESSAEHFMTACNCSLIRNPCY